MPTVRRIVRGITRWPFLAILAVALLCFGLIQAVRPKPAEAATYSDSNWESSSPNLEWICQDRRCQAASPFLHGGGVLSGERLESIPLHHPPGSSRELHGRDHLAFLPGGRQPVRERVGPEL